MLKNKQNRVQEHPILLLKYAKNALTIFTNVLHYLCAQGLVVDHISGAVFACGRLYAGA